MLDQYDSPEHKEMSIEQIKEHWETTLLEMDSYDKKTPSCEVAANSQIVCKEYHVDQVFHIWLN